MLTLSINQIHTGRQQQRKNIKRILKNKIHIHTINDLSKFKNNNHDHYLPQQQNFSQKDPDCRHEQLELVQGPVWLQA